MEMKGLIYIWGQWINPGSFDNYWNTREGWETLRERRSKLPTVVAPSIIPRDRMNLIQLPRPDG